MQNFDIYEITKHLDFDLMINFLIPILLAKTVEYFVIKIWTKIDSVIHSPLDIDGSE